MSKPKAKGNALDELYTRVTNQVIAHLEEGVPTWTRPWKVSRKNGIGIVPQNAVTARPYSGANVLILWMMAEVSGYASNAWLTYKQANEAGGKVRKGERGVQVVYVLWREDEKNPEKKIPTTRYYTVFNVEQCDGLPETIAQPPLPFSSLPKDVAIRKCLETATGHTKERPKILIAGNKAAYLPNRDVIVMPPLDAFQQPDDFYATLAHEVSHFSGAPSRLNRVGGKKFGDNEYAFEELVAELSSAFLCAHFGIEASFRSAQYLDGWLTVLKKDHRAIFTAASHASQSCKWILENGDALVEEDEQPFAEAAE
ncbi:ArdC family protein [Jiella pelagia]|uniref:Zincin-like metallopeptidase domain-containing protein n=1 Tax=Jiella pelagia TaxID=2986949 RepID=A0ABY7C018_9HYPH|nr:zincin-like metallopeptidase domain-containing protein [Jiella pelagia]WAP69023.1 zincin-like metallopeptidase domain-containing protein [Jiella pelagia]